MRNFILGVKVRNQSNVILGYIRSQDHSIDDTNRSDIKNYRGSKIFHHKQFVRNN